MKLAPIPRISLPVVVCLVLTISLGPLTSHASAQVRDEATPAANIRVQEGFQVERLYSVPTDQQGSWVCLTTDDRGRLITSDQDGKLYRIAVDGDNGDSPVIETIDIDLGMAQGLLYAFDSLYVVVNGSAGDGAGLYRVQDTDQDDRFDSVTLLRRFAGGGEHGPHAVILSPDGNSLFICGGNHTDLPDPESSLVPRNWDEDQVLPRMWDAGGHAVNKFAPGGWICKTDPEGSSFELVSSGYRNEYDIAFNSAGDLFTYDADMEWDIGTPWYRPTRICHATAGSEFGWRSGTGKWPVSYPDNLPAVVDIGPGSPTGITFGYGAAFPAKYQNALFIADWSYGIIYAVHMEPSGASYVGVAEQFVSSAALQVSDLVVNPHDGALYFIIGGRKTQSGLYRVTYQGDASTAAVAALTPNDGSLLRRELESCFATPEKAADEESLQLAWQYLGHDDRHVRYAARMILEHAPTASWIADVAQARSADERINAALAVARSGDASHQDAAVELISSLDWETLDNRQRIDLLRAYGLILVRLGEPTDETQSSILAHVDSEYPAQNAELDMELCRLLVAVHSPTVADKTLELLTVAPTQEEQIHYALCLRSLESGWTNDLRRAYFEWFNHAAALRGGNSFTGFLANIRSEAVASLSESESAALRDVIDALPSPIDPIAALESRPVVQEWSVDDVMSEIEADSADRNLDQGKRVFAEAACFKCHRFEGQGGIVGPDLTAAGRRFNLLNLVEALVDPSKVVSDQYQATIIVTDEGKQIVGRIVNLNRDRYMVQEDMLSPGVLTQVNRETIEEMIPSPHSMMPDGLLDTFTAEEILDLIAYLRSGVVLEEETNEQATSIPSVINTLEDSCTTYESSDRPNVVLIISDDQSWNDYSFMGHEVINTPRLDQLARESVTFGRGYVPVALCRPSLATIITGLYPHQHGITGNDPAIPADLRGNPRRNEDYMRLCAQLIAKITDNETLPQALRRNGYVSFQSGKWWEGPAERGGFDAGMTHGDFNRGGRHGDEGLKIGREGLEPIFDFIDGAGDDPFFIWYAPFLPHTPHNPPRRLLEKYQSDGRPDQLARYYAMCEWFDESCGQLLDFLDERDISDNTLVVYVTDNGWIQRTPETVVPEGWRQSFAPRSKQSANEGGTRTPIMIRWPAELEPRMDEQTLVSSIDLMPTILSACGVETDRHLPGADLLPLCRGEGFDRNIVYGEGFAHDIADIHEPAASLRYRWCIEGQWKLLTFHDGQLGRYQVVHQRDDMTPQLFDLHADPHETSDLSDDHPEIVERLQQRLDAWWDPTAETQD